MSQLIRLFCLLILISLPFNLTKAEDRPKVQKFTLSNTENGELRGSYTHSVPFTEKFTYGFPADWIIFDANADEKTWEFQSEIGGRYEMYSRGLGYAYIQNETPNRGNDWLITPQIVIPSGLDDVLFSFYVTATSDVYFKISISESTIDTLSFKLFGYFDEKMRYADDTIKGRPENLISLKEFRGKSIHIAFIDNSPATKRLELTDILLYGHYPTPTGIASTENRLIPFISVQDKSIYFNNISGSGDVEIWDISGKQLDSFTIQGNGRSRQLSKSGIYVIKLKNNEQTFSYKVIIR